jgi:predicted nucleotidyltransferase
VTSRPDLFGPINDALRRSAATLRDAGIPFMLGGSLAFWARGGQETANDLDLMVKPQDAEAALEALAGAGMRPEHPPEEWLLKAWDGDVLIDLIFRPAGIGPIADEAIERADELEVASVRMRVMSLEDALITKLAALGEHDLDYEPLLQTARSLREQVDWASLRDRCEGNPYATAFFVLLEGLEVIDPLGPPGEVDVRALEEPHEEPPALGPAPHAIR